MTPVVSYTLSIAPELEAFRPELEYSCDFLDRCYFVKRTAGASTRLHYGNNAPADALAVPAKLFPDGVCLKDDGIHPSLDRLDSLMAGNLPADTDGSLEYDALALIFCMLSRIEERGATTMDPYGRFIPRAPIAAAGAEPPADRAAQDLARLLTGNPNPQSRTRYEVMLTHDVDRLRGYHRPFAPLRPIIGDIVKRLDPMRAAAQARNAWFSGEPWRSINMLMSLGEAHDQKARFYFMGPTDRSMDSPYAMTMPTLLRRVTDTILARGHIIGFHPGYATATDAREWNRQRVGFEAITDTQVLEGRQHALSYDCAVTPDIWDDAGMSLDTTLGFPEQTGFRSGTCRRFSAYSLRRRRPLKLEQLSTAIMEFGLMGGKYRDLSVDAALAECEKAANTCRAFGGTLVILYHTGQTREPLRGFYKRLLKMVR
jgi:hypothetical protein